jgi:hypothetical protein
MPTILINGLAAVGARKWTVSYGGDSNFNPSTSTFTQQVNYNFIGFLSPLKLQSYSGTFNLGKTVPVKWQLTTYTGSYITMSNINFIKSPVPLPSLKAIFTGQPLSNGTCPLSTVGTVYILYSPNTGTAGNSTFRYDSTNNQFVFNWDTTYPNISGCYTLALSLDDGSPAKTTSLLLK